MKTGFTVLILLAVITGKLAFADDDGDFSFSSGSFDTFAPDVVTPPIIDVVTPSGIGSAYGVSQNSGSSGIGVIAPGGIGSAYGSTSGGSSSPGVVTPPGGIGSAAATSTIPVIVPPTGIVGIPYYNGSSNGIATGIAVSSLQSPNMGYWLGSNTEMGGSPDRQAAQNGINIGTAFANNVVNSGDKNSFDVSQAYDRGYYTGVYNTYQNLQVPASQQDLPTGPLSGYNLLHPLSPNWAAVIPLVDGAFRAGSLGVTVPGECGA